MGRKDLSKRALAPLELWMTDADATAYSKRHGTELLKLDWSREKRRNLDGRYKPGE